MGCLVHISKTIEFQFLIDLDSYMILKITLFDCKYPNYHLWYVHSQTGHCRWMSISFWYKTIFSCFGSISP